jgi:hypothetical protein
MAGRKYIRNGVLCKEKDSTARIWWTGSARVWWTVVCVCGLAVVSRLHGPCPSLDMPNFVTLRKFIQLSDPDGEYVMKPHESTKRLYEGHIPASERSDHWCGKIWCACCEMVVAPCF